MSEGLCPTCGKPPVKSRAGSVMSYFFQHNYCQCGVAPSPKASSNAIKARPGARTLTADRFARRKQLTESQYSASASSLSQTIFPAGTIIGNTFEIVSQIGLGGMGVVYLAEHIGLHRRFALKILSAEFVNDQNWLRFQAEAKILAGLNHRTFVKVFDLGIHEQSVPFYSMDYLQGRTLEEQLAQDGPMAIGLALDTFIEVLDGLAYAHRHGIIHRDLKPGNIMLCTIDGVKAVRVLDFGISKLIGANAEVVQRLTSIGEIFGSPSYMSPEQCRGDLVDARSDIYSIGCTLFEVLSGFVPYEGTTALETVVMHQEQEPPLLSEVVAAGTFPPSIDLVLVKCLAKLPQDRYQSAMELAADLTSIKNGKELLAYSRPLPFAPNIKKNNERLAKRFVLTGRTLAINSILPSSGNKILPRLIGALITIIIVVLGYSYFSSIMSHKNVLKATTNSAAPEHLDLDINSLTAKPSLSTRNGKNQSKMSTNMIDAGMEQANEDYQRSDKALDIDPI